MQLICWRDQSLLRLYGESIIEWVLATLVFFSNTSYFPKSPSPSSRVQTSYVTVEPKRKKRVTPPAGEVGSGTDQPQSYVTHSPTAAAAYPQAHPHHTQEGRPPSRQRREGKQRGERELKRARIVITVRRTAAYKQWLDDNPLQAIIAGDVDDENRTTDTQAEPSDVSKSS